MNFENKLLEKFEDKTLQEIPKEIASKNKSHINYAICMTPRSGSTLLTNMLQQTGLLGYPNEWFNPSSIEKWIETYKVKDIFGYVDCTRRTHVSYNGVFGCELPYFQMKMVLELMTIQQIFDKEPIWFYLRRKDIVLQGISLYRSVESGYFHSIQKDKESLSKFKKIEYDNKKIKFWINHLYQMEKDFFDFFKENKIEPINIYYENIVQNKQATINLFLNVLGISKKFNYSEDKIHKISDSKNLEWKSKFENECSDFLNDLNINRPIQN